MIWLQLAWRDLIRNARRTAFAAGIVLIGTLASLAAAGYMLSTFTAVSESTIHGGIGHLQIATSGEFSGYERTVLEHGLTPASVSEIDRVVEAVAPESLVLPRLSFQGIISNGDRSLVALGEGVDALRERRLSGPYATLVQGQDLESVAASRRYVALVGQEMARLLGVAIGDVVTVLATATGGGLNAIDVEVAGIFSSGAPEIDRMRVVVPIDVARELLRTTAIRRVAVLLSDRADVAPVRDTLAAKLPSLSVRVWQDLAPFYGQLVALYSRQATVFGAIIAGTVTIAVFATVSLGVLERGRDIGTMLSLGIPAVRVRRVFLLQGAVVGGLASAMGGVLAFVLFTLINAVGFMMPPAPGRTEPYPLFISFDLQYAMVAAVAMTLIGLCSAFVASRQVTQRRIIDALQCP